jgi:hypothetical protein
LPKNTSPVASRVLAEVLSRIRSHWFSIAWSGQMIVTRFEPCTPAPARPKYWQRRARAADCCHCQRGNRNLERK